MSQRGIFVTFEGLDGSGKSTQLHRLAEYLKSQGEEVVTTREPGGNPVSDRIRALLLDSSTRNLSALAEMTLMFAARAQNIHQIILPALKAGKFVLCDRFTDSTEAYQGAGRGLGSQTVLEMHALLCQGVRPDLTFLLLSDERASVDRARHRNIEKPAAVDENRFEQEDAAFYDRVSKAFLAIAERESRRMVKINARESIEKTHERIVAALNESLRRIRSSANCSNLTAAMRQKVENA